MQPNVRHVKDYLVTLQTSLRQSLQSYEVKPFLIDEWTRPKSNQGISGFGVTCILQHGKTFDSAGVNFSHVYGDQMPIAATAHRPFLAGRRFEALGISTVMHPVNPFVPTVHMNVRLFIAFKDGEAPIWWFGGGFDLTPYFPIREDVIFWHQVAQKACTPFGEGLYEKYKAWADAYFYLPHRQETRGIGGLFFDDLDQSTWGWDFEKCFAFMQSVGNHFWQGYGPILQTRHQLPFEQQQRDFQLYRRGRYVEFNLVFDRGTLFGLQSGGRTPSILMSLPPTAHWQYQLSGDMERLEKELVENYLNPKAWL